MPSQMRNHDSQKDQKAHLLRALTFKEVFNVHCRSNDCLQMIRLFESYCKWLLSPMSWIKQDYDTDQEISDGDSQDIRESTISSNINEANLNCQEEFPLLGQVCLDMLLHTTMFPLPMEFSQADTLIACPPLPNSQNPPGVMAPWMLKRQKSSLLNRSSKTDHALSAQMLPLPKASGDWNVPQQQLAIFEVLRRFMEAMVVMRTRLPISSDETYSMVNAVWPLAIEPCEHQQAFAGNPVCARSVCQLPSGQSLKIDPQMLEAVINEFCWTLLYQISDIDYVPHYT